MPERPSPSIPVLPIPAPDEACALRTRLVSAPAIWLYGAGSIGQDSLAVLRQAGANVRGFLDAKDLPFSTCQGLPVLKPTAATITSEQHENETVVITIFNAFADIPAIHAKLEAIGWKHIVPFPAFYESFAKEIGNRFWLTSTQYYHSLSAQIEATRKLLVDEKSRTAFDGIIRFRLSGDYTLLSQTDKDVQYFPSDIPCIPHRLRLVDCGAYDGDTLLAAQARDFNIEAYAGFEPDPANFSKLACTASSASAPITLWPCGTWHRTCQLNFASGEGAASAVDARGHATIQCVALDEALPSFQPNFIKMDIEGAEYASLLGAQNIIKTHRPCLAICLYHTPADLWQIPLLIDGWSLGYDFYLRCHGRNGFDLVLYAIPS